MALCFLCQAVASPAVQLLPANGVVPNASLTCVVEQKGFNLTIGTLTGGFGSLTQARRPCAYSRDVFHGDCRRVQSSETVAMSNVLLHAHMQATTAD